MKHEVSIEIDRPIGEVFDYTNHNVAESSITVVEDEVIEDREGGVGSTFRFTIDVPAADPQSVATAAAREARDHEQHGGITPGDGHRPPLRVLLAEDNPVNQKVAMMMLERLGCQADLVETGRGALEALGRQSYDAVLMDMQMPEMDGLETTTRIRSTLSAACQPRIIAMTANASVQDRERCLAAGMNDFLCKPVMLRDLAAVLDRARPVANGSERRSGELDRHDREGSRDGAATDS